MMNTEPVLNNFLGEITMNISLGAKIKELRTELKRTQTELAEALSISPQAVSRWEVGVSYPDLDLLPSIANYFGVTIDSLFGYDGERSEKINALCERLRKMNRENNGEDVSMDECIRLAREGLIEFPGNKRIMLCLADILYNAGYVRHGEFHLTDENGYEVFDVERHKKYSEWQEAISLYEKLLDVLEDGDDKYGAVKSLATLYAVSGENEKAAKLAKRAPEITGCREFLRICGYTGIKRAEAYEESVTEFAYRLVQLMIHCEISRSTNDPIATAKSVASAIAVGDAVISTGYRGDKKLRCFLAENEMFLADRLWQANDDDGAFAALDRAYERAESCDADLLHQLPELYPWFCVKETRKENIKNDPRWNDWVIRTEKPDIP